MEIVKIAQECVEGHAFTTFGYHPFSIRELQQFAQRIERPLLNQIENQRLNCEVAYKYACYMREIAIQRDAQIEQLQVALQALYDEQNGPPLIRDAARWESAMQLSSKALEASA